MKSDKNNNNEITIGTKLTIGAIYQSYEITDVIISEEKKNKK